jgi:hypothetical protein
MVLDSSSANAVNFSSARITKRFPLHSIAPESFQIADRLRAACVPSMIPARFYELDAIQSLSRYRQGL